jgi:hydrogenase nickel incorporation protein HypA/HybF
MATEFRADDVYDTTGGDTDRSMHELRIATEIIDVVRDEMTRRHLNRVTEVYLNLGALTGVDPEALAFGFEAATADTPLSGAALKINRIPVGGKCRTCRSDFELNEYVFVCPKCGSSDLEIFRGEELDIAYFLGD